MNLNGIINRVRSYTRDFNGSIYRENDITQFSEEAINRIAGSIYELRDLNMPVNKTDEIKLLPKMYHHLLAIYATSRCFMQDEQDYRAGALMNEFEGKLEELSGKLANGEIKIKDSNGNEVLPNNDIDYISDVYFVENSDDDIFTL